MRGFYQGVVPSLISTIPFSGINMSVFMGSKDMWKRKFKYADIEPLPPSVCVLLSVVSTLSAQLVSYPLYCVKTNLQAENASVSFVAEVRKIVADRGIARGLYGGLSMNFFKALPSVAVSFTIYEQAKGIMGLA